MQWSKDNGKTFKKDKIREMWKVVLRAED